MKNVIVRKGKRNNETTNRYTKNEDKNTKKTKY